jgi:UDP-N-acetylmuramoylalanine--D-glutamate ligase
MKLHIPDWLSHRLQKPVAVFGGGVSGSGAARLAAALGAEVIIYDRDSEQPLCRSFGPIEAANHGLVVVSPGFAPAHEWIRAARSAGCEIINEMDFAALAWPGRIVGVTGTNGKTTVCEFLTHALRTSGFDAHTAGNIGTPLSVVLATNPEGPTVPGRNSIAVCELSSFQTEGLKYFEAEASIWTNFAEDHLDRHESLEAYFHAKYNLVRRTRESTVVHGASVAEFAKQFGMDIPDAHLVSLAARGADERVTNTVFGVGPQRENFLLVLALWRLLGLPEKKLIEAARSFTLPAHRLAAVGEVRGVAFWNDSKATNFHAAEAAASCFARPVTWIGGGQSKGGDAAGFVARMAPFVRKAFVIGATREELARHLHEQATPVKTCESLRDAIVLALESSAPGDVVLFSPGFSSFDMFEGYADRGRQFAALVAELVTASGTRPEPTTNPPSKSSAQAGLCLL